MTPSELKNYLQQRKQASLEDIAVHFDTDVETVKGAISLWQRKGKVVENSPSPSNNCAGCCQCDPNKTTIYCWKEEP